MIFTGGWVCDGLRMLDLFDGQVNKYSKVLAPKATLTRIWVKSVRYKDQECTEKYGLNLIFKGIVLTPKQKKKRHLSGNAAMLIFSSLSSYSTHKRRTLSSCETTAAGERLSTTGVPTVLHLFYHATGWFVWIPNWQSSTFDILEGHQHVPPRWVSSQPFLQVAPLSCTMRVWRRCVRRRSSSVSTSKISTCCWDWSPSAVTQIIRGFIRVSNISTNESEKTYLIIPFVAKLLIIPD